MKYEREFKKKKAEKKRNERTNEKLKNCISGLRNRFGRGSFRF